MTLLLEKIKKTIRIASGTATWTSERKLRGRTPTADR
jgi:hypothetical protein